MLRAPITTAGIPEHELAVGEPLRALDPVEHNMERLNARARGSSIVYHAVRIEGPLEHEALVRAVLAATNRHPMMRVRVARDASGALVWMPTRGDREDGTARVPVTRLTVDDLETWPEVLESDMNAGAIDSARGPLFAFALLEPRGLLPGAHGERIVVMIGHHAVCDAISCLAVLDELLAEMAAPRPWAPLLDRPVEDPFRGESALPELVALEEEAISALADTDAPRRAAAIAVLAARLERIEEQICDEAQRVDGYPASLRRCHQLLARLTSGRGSAVGVAADVDLGQESSRYERARTGLIRALFDREQTAALREAAKRRQLTLHGPLCAAVLLAQAQRHAELAVSSGGTFAFPADVAIATAVSLRGQLVPPLERFDLRMAIDVVVSRIRVAPDEHFWSLASRVGHDVTRAVARRRVLSSWFRTQRRDLQTTPPGLASVLVSNVGAIQMKHQYGPLRVLDVAGAMATHGSFQIATLVGTFDDRLGASFYFESPTVSRESMQRFVSRVLVTLERVARGENPPVSGSVVAP